ncbi:MAG: hypothetical protein RL653_113 [Pseudomonadota bacterium]|jgi:type VI secretion system protein ImpG
MDDALYKTFLAEMEELEKFRMAYAALHPRAPLGREDQDVRRLVESLAFFTARTRLSGQRSILRSTLRLFRQHFSFVLDPLPSMGLLRARTDARFVDAAEVPRGTLVAVSRPAENTAAQEPPSLQYRTTAPLRLLPVRLESVDTWKRGPQEGQRLMLRFAASFPRNDELGAVRLYVRHLGEFTSSLAAHHHLKRALHRAFVVFDENVGEDSTGAPCRLRFGAPPVAPEAAEAFEHPLQRARAFLQYPEQALFVDLELPTPPRNWRTFTVCLDLSPRFPSQLRLNVDSFELNVVPLVNAVRQTANPVEWDGTREAQLLTHPDASAGFRLHSLVGVYRLDADKGLVPLRPGVVDGGEASYEVDVDGNGAARRALLSVELPGAFERPAVVSADAFWLQPLAQPLDPAASRVRPSDRHLEGVAWDCLGALSPSVDNPLGRSQDGLLRLLSLKNQRFLGLGDLQFLLSALGAADARHFRELLPLLEALSVATLPFARAGSGFKYVYRLRLAELDPYLLPLVDLFSAQLLDLLRAWSTEEIVELVVHVPNLELEQAYPQPEVLP